MATNERVVTTSLPTIELLQEYKQRSYHIITNNRVTTGVQTIELNYRSTNNRVATQLQTIELNYRSTNNRVTIRVQTIESPHECKQ